MGLSSFQTEPVFVAHLLVTIRQRMGQRNSERLNDMLLEHARRIGAIKHRQHPSDQRPPTDADADADADAGEHPDHEVVESSDDAGRSAAPPRNRGRLMLDATVHPMNIAYPTDTRLLHEAREWSETLIDAIFGVHPDLWKRKPRTYRRVARKQYMAFSKKRRTTKKENRRAVKGQLQYLRRNLKTLHTMLDRLDAQERSCAWTVRQWRHFWIIQELYRQQAEMYRDRRRRVDNRIVSIEQPHVRPIKRGKGGTKNTEFGPKVNLSLSEGLLRADQIEFDNFSESTKLIEQVEDYKRLYGYYPARVLADKIYWTHENRKWLKTRKIDIGGVPMGRKKEQTKYQREKERKKTNARSQVEGAFGNAKTRYGMERIKTKRPDTTKASINLSILAINLVRMSQKMWVICLVLIMAVINGLILAVHRLVGHLDKPIRTQLILTIGSKGRYPVVKAENIAAAGEV